VTLQNQEARSSSGLFVSKFNIRKLFNSALDLIFPPMCHGCGRVDTYWCDGCLEDLQNVPIQVRNYNPEILTELCATYRHIGKVQQAIHALKYYNAPRLAKPLGNRLVEVLKTKNWTFDTIIPVPLFPDRLQKRGYNQAYLLSQQVEQAMTITCQPNLLSRFRDTNHQVGLNALERRENVKDAFVVTEDVTGKSILLIDDVVTTGATLDECAIALLDAGAKSVYAITVSHA